MATLQSADAPFAAPRPVKIAARRRENHDTVSIDIVDGMEVEPGQFNMLYAFGKGEVPISVSARSGGRITHTTRNVGLVTAALTSAAPGTMIGIRGPFGHGWPVSALRGKDVVVVAGGLGLAPLRPALHAMLDNRDEYGRLVLLYGARTPGDLLFVHELERWRGRFDVEVLVTVDVASSAWRGEVGVVTRLFSRLAMDPDHSAALVCGPEVMMRFAASGLLDVGIEAENVWLSMERNMQCGAGVCGHCQVGPFLVCRDGPVLPFSKLAPIFKVKEL